MDNEECAYRPGDVLAGKYRVDRTIGLGGFGAVLQATHLQLEERVAIKVLLPQAAKNEAASQRFLREARAAVKIKSEHVARVTDVSQLPDGTPYMVMEYLDGQDLSGVLKDHGAQGVAEVAEWVLQACEALAEAHALGIVHRDLKPANLFLTRRVDGSPCVKVLDFGISKLSNEGDKGMTKTSDVMGSPFYMSPEQMRSTRSVDTRSDIWALGAILFEMLAGAPPFDAETMTALVVSIMQEPPRELSLFRNDIPAPMRDVILTCLQKDPNHRYQDVASLANALMHFAPARARQHVQRVFAISGRNSHPHPSSGPHSPHGLASLAAGPTAPGAEITGGGFNRASSSGPMATPYGHSPSGYPAASHPSGSHPSGSISQQQFGQAHGNQPYGAAYGGHISQPQAHSPIPAMPAQSWGGTYMSSKKQGGGSKVALFVGLGALFVAILGGGSAAWYFASKSGSTASTKKSTASHDASDSESNSGSKQPKESANSSGASTAAAPPTETVAPPPTATTNTLTATVDPPKSDPPKSDPPKIEPIKEPVGKSNKKAPPTSTAATPPPTPATIALPPPPPLPPPASTPTATQKKPPPKDPLFGSPD